MAWFEVGNSPWRHFDSCSRFWIASDAAFSLARAKTPEAANLNLFTSAERMHNAVEDQFDDDGRFFVRNLHQLGDLIDQIRPPESGFLRFCNERFPV